MSRRRIKEADMFGLIAPLVGLVFLIMVFSPQARQVMIGFGYGVLYALAVVLGLILAWILYRHFTPTEKSTFAASPPVTISCRTAASPAFRPSVSPGGLQGPARPSVSSIRPDHSPKNRQDLISQLRTIDWYQFEKLVGLAYRRAGYLVTSRGGANPDGGIDLILHKDGHCTAVQCKQWKAWKLGAKVVREFMGALKEASIDQGIFITLKGCTDEAKRLADKHQIAILNEFQLAQMLETADGGFDPAALALLQDQRKFCPKCENQMVIRTAGKGSKAGHNFWGCSQYPRCHYTLDA